MNHLPDFEIKPNGIISEMFLSHSIFTFRQAIEFIRNLPYGRNTNKDDLKTVFTDNVGTCGTKHALLMKLAVENNLPDITLTLGIFKMNGINTPKVRDTLAKNKLDYMPEAHVYLTYQGQRFDFTNPGSMPSDFVDDLLLEEEILPEEINRPKIERHKKYLSGWLRENEHIKYSHDEIWKIREQCIRDLSA